MIDGLNQSERFCLACKHSLRGIRSRNCPECGQAFDPDNSHTTSPTASFVRPRWLALWCRFLTAIFGLLAVACFLIALLGMDPFYMWVLGLLGSPLLLPAFVFVLVMIAMPSVPLRPRHRICGILFPLLIVSIALTYWPFRITFLLHKSRLNEIVDQVQAGKSPSTPMAVGCFHVHSIEQQRGNIGLHIRGSTIDGTHLVRCNPWQNRAWGNTNWEFSLGDGWYYLYED